MADTVVKTVEDVDKLFSQIVVNGETYNSDRYVPPAPIQVIEEPEPEPQQTEPSQNPSVPSGQTIQGEDVYAVVLNDEQHNFVDPEEVTSRTEADTTLQGNINSINALIPSDTTTSNKLVNESGIQDAVNTAVENAVADLDVPSVGGTGKYISAISETNGKISATEGTIATAVESGNNNPVTSDAVNSAIQSSSGDVSQLIAQAIGALDVASTGGSGKYISAISETDGKISATEGTIDSSVTGGSGNPVTGGAVNTAITNAIGALDVASAGGSGKYISAISETDGKISATEGTIDSAVTSGSNNPVTSDAVSSAISSISGDVTQQISDAIGALDVASAGGSGKYISAISETDGKISATEGTIDNVVTSGSTNPVTGGAVNTAIESAIASIYKPAGDKTVAQLTSALLVAGNLGNVYNITDSGTTTSDFVEGAGKSISAGDNVAIVDTGSQGSPSYKFDLLSGFIDLSNYIQKSQTQGLVKNDGTIDTTAYASQSSLNGYIQKSQTQGLVKNDGSIDTTAYAKQSEMSVTPGTGADSDKTTIQLKTGTSATVLTQHIPAGTSTPVMDGTGSAGSSTNYARADHVHPSDMSKQDVLTFDSAPTENSTNPVTSGGVYTALQEKSSATDLPTDSVLHYSFDEVPDYPDGSADVRLIDNNTYDIQTTNYYFYNNGGVSFSNVNGNLQIGMSSNGANTSINNTLIANKIVKIKIKIVAIDGVIKLFTNPSTGIDMSAIGEYEYTWNNATNNRCILYCGSGNSATVEISQIYIGDGSYTTPIIDNANGQWNGTNYGSIPVQGVSGKAIKSFLDTYKPIKNNDFKKAPPYSFAVWVKVNANFTITQYIIDGRDGTTGADEGILFLADKAIEVGSIGGQFVQTNGGDVPIGEWIHLAVVTTVEGSGNRYKIYKNGSLIKEGVTTVLNQGFKRLTINGQYEDYALYSKCERELDDFLFFNRALSDTEVKALYLNKANTPKYYPPLTMVDSELSTESSNPVENKVITSRLNEMTEIASSLPTDAVLHYSFDEVPDYPDGTADVRILDGQTYQLEYGNYAFNANDSGAFPYNDNGTLECRINNSAFYLGSSYFNKIFKCKIQVTAISGTLAIHNGYQNIIKRITEVGTYELTILNTNSQTYKNIYFYCNASGYSCTFKVLEVYCGDGSYSTPIIDNANGQYNSISQSGVAVQGVSGKGVKQWDSRIEMGYFNLNDNFTISIWVKPENNTTGKLAHILRKDGQFILRNGTVNTEQLQAIVIQNNQSTIIGGSLLSANTWQNLVVIKDNLQFCIYINGIRISQTTLSQSSIDKNDNVFYIGRYDNNNPNTRPQSYDDLLIFDRALSETEVLALYQNKANTPKYYLGESGTVKSVCSQLPDSSGNVALTKSNVGLGSVVNTEDSATPLENGATKFTTGGAFDFFAKSVTSSSWLGKVLGRFMGRKWTLATMGLYTPAYGGGVWVAGSESSGLWYKEGNNGTWTQVTVNISSTRKAYTPVYANGLWVTLANNTSGMYNVWWSTDGKNWTAGSIPSYSIQMNIAYVNGLWVAGTNNSIIWSEDGKTWNNSNISGAGFSFYKPTYANGLWHIGTEDTRLYWSSDGKNWTLCTGSFTSLYHIYSPVFNTILNQWFAGSSSGLYKSNDGKAWDKITGDTASVNMFTPVAVGSLLIAGSTNGLWYSYTGSSWTQCLSSGETKTPLYANGTFITNDGSYIYVSDNGIDWHIAEYDGSPSNLSYPFYANGMWMIGTESTDELIYSDIEMVMENLTD